MRYSFMIVAVAVLLSAAAWLKEQDSEPAALSQSVGTFSENQTDMAPQVLPQVLHQVLPEILPETLSATQGPRPTLLPEGEVPVRGPVEIMLIGGDFLYEENADRSVTSCLLRGGLSMEDPLCRQDTEVLYRPEQVRP